MEGIVSAKKRRRRRRRAAPVKAPEQPLPQEKPSRRRGAREPGPYPQLGVTLARGFAAVGASPLILALAFLTLLVLWSGYAAMGTVPSPRVMADLLALPPAHINLDAILVAGEAGTTLGASAVLVGVMAVRAAAFGLLTLLVVSAVRDGAPDLPGALRRLPRTALVLLVIYVAEIGLVLAIPILLQSLLGPQLAVLGILAALVLGLHFFVLGPVIVATEGEKAPEALRRSARAARLPGTRHMTLVLAYFFFVFYASLVTPDERTAAATPTVLVWAFSLLATFVHLGVLAGLAYRWITVREQVPRTERAPAR